MFYRFLFIISALSLLNLWAQVNTEKFRPPYDFKGFGGLIRLSGHIKTGNTDKTEGNLDGRLDWETERTTTFFVFETEHEWINNKLLSGNGLLHLRNVVSLDSNFKSEIFVQVNYDRNLLLNNRELFGAGFRYLLLKIDEGDFAIGTTYMYEIENYDLPMDAIHPVKEKISRWSNYLSFYLKLTESVTIGGVIYYQPSFLDFSDYRILNEQSVQVSLTKVLSFVFDFKLRHDSVPPDGIEKMDTKTQFGIGFKF